MESSRTTPHRANGNGNSEALRDFAAAINHGAGRFGAGAVRLAYDLLAGGAAADGVQLRLAEAAVIAAEHEQPPTALDAGAAWTIAGRFVADAAAALDRELRQQERIRRAQEHVAEESEAEADAELHGNGEDALPRVRVAVMTTLSDVEPEPTQYLWHPYIPRGRLTLLEGDPGNGKSTLCATLAAILTRGWPLPNAETGRPGGASAEPSTVVWLSGEDALADTVVVRLEVVGADRSRIHALTAIKNTETGKVSEITLADIDVLEDALDRCRPALVVVDPLVAYLGARVDMHRANEVRPILQRLSILAERYDVAVIGVRHLSKSDGRRAIYRGQGSIDFSATARSILLAGADPSDAKHLALIHVKSSTAARGAAIGYAMTSGEIVNKAGQTCQASRIEWTGISTLTAEQVLAAPPVDDGMDRETRIAKAEMFLQTELADGPRPLQELIAAAEATGLQEKLLYKARHRVKIKSGTSAGFPRRTIWSLAVSSPNPTGTRRTGSTGSTGNERNLNEYNSTHSTPCSPSAVGEEPPPFDDGLDDPGDDDGADADLDLFRCPGCGDLACTGCGHA